MKTRLLTTVGIVALLLLAEGAWVYAFLPHAADATRNSAGTVSLATSTVVSGQVVGSALWNNTWAGIRQDVEDSLDRSGRGGMLAALRGIDGTVAAPALSWTSETGSGLYRIGAGDLGLAILGTKAGEWTANGYRSANGAVATPSLSFFNDTGSGLYRAGSNDIRMAINGADVASFNASGTATNDIAKFFEPSLANGNWSRVWTGKSTSANAGGFMSFKPNATAANSTTCLATAGQSDTLCVDGNNKTYIGSTGTGIATISAGSCTLNGGTPATCTATVVSGAKCVASKVQTGGGTAQSVSVTTTTLTVTSAAAGDTAVANYFCWI